MSTVIVEKTAKKAITLLILIAFSCICNAQLSVPFEPRLPGGNIKVKGDLVYVANNIVSVASNPNVAYNGSSSNQSVTMDYIDIDGDSNTFSSSIAELNAPSCSAVVYAGLYWGGIYRNTNRGDAYKNVKFKLPGGSYIDIGPSSNSQFEYEQIYDKAGDRDGDGFTDPGVIDVDYLSGVNMTSYLNYANVTHLLSGLTDPNGAYTVANIVASTGERNVSAGWTMVVIYENLNSTNKYISTFDGYAAMGSTYKEVNFPFSGFKTVPAPLPVNAVIGASTMDGDRITGPSMRFRANPSDSWTYLNDAINPSNNVFNSTITNQGSWVDTRTPASHNTLGWDADILKLTNPDNSVLPNDHDNGEILISTSSEGVILFLTTVAVEIINPEILVEKKVEDLAGQDITGAGVELGDSLEYVLRFWNRGNDNATNFSIRDILPDNVAIQSIDLDNAPGTTTSTNPSNPKEITFNIPDVLVTKESNTYEIRIKVKVSNDCHDFVEACSSTINNTAYSTYDGVTSGQTISDDPSVSNVSNCGFVTVGATNFLLDDLTNCSFKNEVQICGDRTELSAGSGYDSYTWYKDTNLNGQLDSSDIVYTDSNPDNDPTTVSVQETGFYFAEKESASCGTNVEIYDVTRFGSTQLNPIINYFNTLNSDANVNNDIQGEIVTCSNDNSELPKLFLCGTNDSQEILLNITDALSMSWQKLDEATCAITNPDCPNNQIGCSYNEVATGNTFTANTEGRYRLVLSYSGGCNSIFYFDVFQNNLDFDYDSDDIYCSTDGFIRIENVGAGYGYQLVDTDSGAIVVPYSANNGPNFSIADSGIYRVDFTQLDPSTGEPLNGSCVFSTENVGIEDQNLTLNLTTKPVTCISQGSARLQVGQGRANYYYRLYSDNGTGAPGTLIDDELTQTSSDFTFEGLNAGDYVIEVSTDDSCKITKSFTINEIPDPQVSAVTTKHITCTDGLVSLTGTEGAPNPSYLYAIWEKDGSTFYSSISDIPSSEFQRDTIAPGVFNFVSGEAGTYRFVIVDGNNCWSLSNEITLNDLGDISLAAPTIVSEVKCEGSSTGQVTMNVSGAQTPYSYSIDDWATQQSDPTFVNLSPGTYTVKARSLDGCEDEISFILDDPESFKANAGVSSTGTCDINEYSEVRFTNVEGGTAPYQFSFDGGSTFISDDISNPSVRTSQLPSGSHILIAKDSRGCQITIPITIDEVPPVPEFDYDLDYDCDGNGNIVFITNQTIYNYVYTINTTPEISVTDGDLAAITPGTYTVNVEYTENNPPNPSVLLLEDFGSGPTVDSEFTIGYTFEDQEGSNTYINDFEYSITSYIVSPFGTWLRPDDHTSNGTDANGRYLVINVGSPQPDQVIYQKPIVDIIPNQDMRVSFSAINLLKSGGQLDPNIYVQMRIPGTETVVGEVQSGDIPKNNDWNTYQFSMNPGSHTELDFIIISKKKGNNGNDVAIDDILVEQIPKSCPRTIDIPVVIEDGNAFEASIIGYNNVTCNADNDGTITFDVDNFDTIDGFEYSIDGGSTWILSKISPVTTNKVLSAGTNNVIIRRANDTSCSITLTQEIDEPDAFTISTSIEQNPTCGDPTGIIKAIVSGGTPTYEYALEDELGNSLVAFPNSTGSTFNGLTAGKYVIVVRDIKDCSEKSAVITLADPVALTYSIDSTKCYDGSNNATIELTANTGSGTYLFQLNGGTWQTPNPSSLNTYTFSGLSNGTYTVNVKDSNGCDGGVSTVVINEQILVNTSKTDVSMCADGEIVVNASGGNGTLVYAMVSTGNTPTIGDFVTSSNFTIDNALALANPSGFDIYVRDNNGNSTFCEFVEAAIIVHTAVDWELDVIAEEPNCNGGNGSIQVDIQKLGGGSLSATEANQVGPFNYTLYQGGSEINTISNISALIYTFNNTAAGTYEVRVTDGSNCTVIETTIDIVDPPVLTAEVETNFAAGMCTPAFGFNFKDYPTSGLNGTLEFSFNNGGSWRTSDTFNDLSLTSGQDIQPSIRTIDGSGNTLCRYDLPTYTLTYPLDNLDIDILPIIVNCNQLVVKVQGTQGNAPYIYAVTEDPNNFDPATASWSTTPKGANDPHEFSGLTPGRTYTFYAQDASGCIRESLENVNDLIHIPLEITNDVVPSCNGADSGAISFTLNPDTAEPYMRWELFEVGNTSPILFSGTGASAQNIAYNATIQFTTLPVGNYYIEVTQVNNTMTDACHGGSENIEIKEQLAITASVTDTKDIGCNQAGLISVSNINGGTAPYTFSVTGPAGFTSITATSQNPIEIQANSPAGDYEVTITDVYGCTISTPYIVNMELTANPLINDIQVENCNGSTELTVSATSLANNLRYAMVTTGNPAPTNFLNNGGVFANVIAGDYDIYVIDGNGCSTTQTTFSVAPILQANTALTKLLDCSTSPNAIIEIEALQGSGLYEYSVEETISNTMVVSKTTMGGNSIEYHPTASGTYEVKVYVDATANHVACERTFTIVISNNIEPEFTAKPTDVTCNGANDGSITITQIDNGISPLTYELLDSSLNPVPSTDFTYDNTTKTFNGLAPIDYVVRAIGTNDCSKESLILSIDEPTSISVTIPSSDVIQFGCAAGNNSDYASITVNTTSVAGGTGNFVQYEFVDASNNVIQNGTNNKVFITNTTGATYTINVYDNTGCMGTTTVFINSFDELISADIVVDDQISCANNGDTITITANGSNTDSLTTGHNYSFENVATGSNNTTGVFADLEVGNHSFKVTNTVTNCTIIVSHIVKEIEDFDINVINDKPIICAGDISQNHLEISGGYTGNFNWSVFDTKSTLIDNSDDTAVVNGSGSLTLSGTIGLQKGTYRIIVEQVDFPFCSEETMITIGGSDIPLDANISEIGNASCSNNIGRLSIEPTGGIAPYTISIPSLGLTQTDVYSYVFTNLSDGNYAIEVTDAVGCENKTLTGNILTVDPILADITPTVQTLNCIGDANGSISATLTSGGVGTVLYSLNTLENGSILTTSATQTSSNFSGLKAGNYSITISDDGGCSYTSNEVIINDPETVVGSLVISTSLTCAVDAQLTLTVNGGTPFLGNVYQFSTSETGPFTNMNAGNTHVFDVMPNTMPYAYYIKDANGCTPVLTNSVTINDITPLTAELDLNAASINCNGESTASISARASGGLGDYTYGLYYDSSMTQAATPTNSLGYFDNLSAGTYYVGITSGDCEWISTSIAIIQPEPLHIANTVTNVSCMGADDGTITMTVTGGTQEYQYAISPNLNQFDDQNTFTDLAAGDYTVIVQDAKGCFEVLEYKIQEPDALSLTMITEDEVCFESEDGMVTLNIEGGTAPYSTSLNSNDNSDFVQGKFTYSNLPKGTHLVFIKDANGCILEDVFTIESGVNLAGTAELIYECDALLPSNYLSLQLEDESISSELMYSIDSTDPNDLQLQLDFTNIAPGEHTLTIAHSNGCINMFDFVVENFEPLSLELSNHNFNEITAEAFGGNPDYTYQINDAFISEENIFFINRTDTFTVTVTDENGCSVSKDIFMEFIDIEIPNFFTPDGDGLNDRWKPKNIEIFPNITIAIYDRYGRKLYKMVEDTEGWDGFYNDTSLPMGDYWYIIKLNGDRDAREFVGHFSLYR